MLLKKLLGAIRTRETHEALPVEYPLEVEARLNAQHGRVPVREHLEILYGDLRLGAEGYVDLYFRCLEQTGTAVTPFNVFQRFQTRHALVRYFLATLDVPGARVECGAYRGATALLLCHVWRSVDAAFRGGGFYLVDSFTGTSVSTAEDLIPVQEHGGARMQSFFPAGRSDVTPEMVRGFFADFPEAQLRSGWVPDVFRQIEAPSFAFVHVDLTLYEATRGALEFFYPRLSEGGVILCDGSLFCPGVEKALERFSRQHAVPYATLGHRQYVILKRAGGSGRTAE